MKSKKCRFEILHNTLREAVFRTFCRHRQGTKPNILLFCSRRGGSTWFLNTLAAHPGMRYVGRPFDTLHRSRWRKELPKPSPNTSERERVGQRIFIHYEGSEEAKFRDLARSIVMAERHIYPTLNFRAPYFHRVTDRVVFQLTNTTALIEWFDQHFDVDIVVLLRHPIPTALSTMNLQWEPECQAFLGNDWFLETQLTSKQIDLAQDIMAKGSELHEHVLDWTLKMLVPVRAYISGTHTDWLMVTYEETIVSPRVVLEALSWRLDLPDIVAMEAQMKRPSRTVTATTAGRIQDPEYLLNRWRKKIGPELEAELMSIPKAFDIDVYCVGASLPAHAYLVQANAIDGWAVSEKQQST